MATSGASWHLAQDTAPACFGFFCPVWQSAHARSTWASRSAFCGAAPEGAARHRTARHIASVQAYFMVVQTSLKLYVKISCRNRTIKCAGHRAMAFNHTIPPSRPDMGRWRIENTGCCFEPMRDILPTTQKHIYILFHNSHFQSKNAAWPIIENTPLVPHLKKNLFPRGTGPFRFLPIPMGGNITC